MAGLLVHVALIIPTHNRHRLLIRTMPYYLKLKGVEEIIIVDDCSKDQTPSYIRSLNRRDSRICYLRMEKRSGPHHCRNLGIAHLSKTIDHVILGEDDVIMPPDYVSSLLSSMHRLGSDIIAGRLLSLDAHEDFEECSSRYAHYLKQIRQLSTEPPLVNKRAVQGNFFLDSVSPAPFVHACSLVKRSVVDKIRFDGHYRFGYFREETDFYIDARMKGFRIHYDGSCVCYHMTMLLERLSGGGRNLGLRLPHRVASLVERIGFPRIVFDVINNNYFLDKYYHYLKRELRYEHCKRYYKVEFVLCWLKRDLRILSNFLESLVAKRDVAWKDLMLWAD